MTTTAEQLDALGTQVNNLAALVTAVRDPGKLYSMLGNMCVFGCQVTAGYSSADMILCLNGSLDSAHLNPDGNDAPVRPEEYRNIALIYGEVFYSANRNVSTLQDANLTVSAAPSTGYHRYDIVYAYVGTVGPAVDIAAGMAVLNASTPTDPVLPHGALQLARVHVQGAVTAITSGDITDLRSFSGRLGSTQDAINAARYAHRAFVSASGVSAVAATATAAASSATASAAAAVISNTSAHHWARISKYWATTIGNAVAVATAAATNAATSASGAATSAVNAAISETNAGTSATRAKRYASRTYVWMLQAQTSATSATASQASATISAAAALASQIAAAGSATSASASQLRANRYADRAYFSSMLAGTYASALTGTSPTNLTVAASVQTLMVEPNKAFGSGFATIADRDNPTTRLMFGAVQSYDKATGTLIVSVSVTVGTGSASAWIVSISGARGVAGTGTVNSVDATGGAVIAGGGPLTLSGTVKGQYSTNAQTGTSYSVAVSGGSDDRGKLLTFSNASAVAVSVPSAATATDPVGWYADFQNRGAGTVTITPTTSTIDGAATLTLATNEGVRLSSDGTNYFTQRGKASITSNTIRSPATRLYLASNF